MSKILAMVAMLAFAANVNAGTIETDDAAVNLEILITGELLETYKVSVTNGDMDGAASPVGVLSVTDPANSAAPVNQLSPAASHAATACHDTTNTLIAYTQGGSSCTYVPGVSIATSQADFVQNFDVAVELAGSGSIDLAVSLGGNLGSADPFAASEVRFNAAAYAATAAITGLLDTGTAELDWKGSMDMDQGPTFEENVIIDITKN